MSVFCENDFALSRDCIRITGHEPGLWNPLIHLRLDDCGPSELIVIGAGPESCASGDGPGEAILNLASWQRRAERNTNLCLSYWYSIKYQQELEARVGIEPTHKGFAVYRTTPKSLRKQGTSAGRSPPKPAF